MDFGFVRNEDEDKLIQQVGSIRTANSMTSFTFAVSSQDTIVSYPSPNDERLVDREIFVSKKDEDKSTKRKFRDVTPITTSLFNFSEETKRRTSTVSVDGSEPRDLKGLLYLSGSIDPLRGQGPTGLLVLSFPMKLHLMLEVCAHQRAWKNAAMASTTNKRQKKEDSEPVKCVEEYENRIIIGWLKGGTSFKIYDEERFVREVMPTYFVGGSRISINSITEKPELRCSFHNFQRNLDMWGFNVMPCVEGPKTRKVYVCSHPLFSRNDPSACRMMNFKGVLP